MGKEYTMQEKLAIETINMINSASVRFLTGAEFKWYKGMLDYHLPMLIARATAVYDKQLVNETLFEESFDAILDYINYRQSVGYDNAELIQGMLNAGIKLNLDGLATG